MICETENERERMWERLRERMWENLLCNVVRDPERDWDGVPGNAVRESFPIIIVIRWATVPK